jgi:hypothetical protein
MYVLAILAQLARELSRLSWLQLVGVGRRGKNSIGTAQTTS